MYNGEAEMLKLRLLSLNATIDYFIIMESGCTFSSHQKPYYFRDRDRQHAYVQPFLQRIIHVEVQQHCPHPSSLFSSDANGNDSNNSNNSNKNSNDSSEEGIIHNSWEMEKQVRNAALQGISAKVPPSALLMISDVDELPSNSAMNHIRNNPSLCQPGRALHFHMNMYYYDLSSQVSSELWYHPQIMTVQDARDGRWSPQSLRDLGFELSRAASTGNDQHTIFKGNGNGLAGWHMSYFGNDADRTRKIQSFSHQEFNTPSVINALATSREHRVDPLGRPGQHLESIQTCNLASLPPKVVEYPHYFGHFAPHCPTARPACWKHIQNKWKDGIINFTSSRNYIHGGEGGGLTNQIVGIKNGLLIAHETNIPIQLPFGFSRLSWNDETDVWKYKTIPFSTLFSSIALLSDKYLNNKICMLTKREVESFVVFMDTDNRPKNRPKNTTRINVLQSVHQQGWRYLNISFLADIIRNEMKPWTNGSNAVYNSTIIYEVWLGATSDLIWADAKTNTLASYILQNIRFSSTIETIASNIISIFRELNATYFGLHLRLDEYDSSAFVGEKGGEAVPHQVIHLVQQYMNNHGIVASKTASPLAYVASGNRATSVLNHLPWPSTRKEMLLPESIEQMKKCPEMLGAVDFLVCEHSDYFVGFSHSTFSALIKLRRYYNGKRSSFYNTPEPPWQIVLTLDPIEEHYNMVRQEQKRPNCSNGGSGNQDDECKVHGGNDRRFSIHPGQKAEYLFTNV